MRVFALACLCTVLFVSASASAQRKPRVALVVVNDATGAGGGKVREELERAFLRHKGLDVVRYRTFSTTARVLRIPRNEWLQKDALGAISDELALNYAVYGRLTMATRYSYLLTLYAINVDTMKIVAKSGAQLSIEVIGGAERPALSSVQLTALVRELAVRMPGRKARPRTPPRNDAVEADDENDDDDGSSEQQSGSGAGGDVADGSENEGAGDGAVESGGEGFGEDWGDAFGDEPAFDTPVGEGADAAGDDFSQILGDLTVKLGGRIKAEVFAYPLDPVLGREQGKSPGRASVEAALRPAIGGAQASAAASLVARKDFGEPSRDRLDLEEAVVDVDLFGVQLRGGRAFLAWGTANLYNPTDVLNAYDLRDPVETERLASWVVRLGWGVGPLFLEGYWLPVPAAHLVPFPDRIDSDGTLRGPSRWLSGRVEPDEETDVTLRYHLRPEVVPPPALEHTQLALRAKLSLFGADASLGYVTRIDPYPTLRADAVVAKPLPLYVDVFVEREHLRQHLVTADFEYVLGKIRFAGEGLVGLTADLAGEDDDVDDPFFKGVLGLDWQTAQFFDTHYVHLFAEVAGSAGLYGALPDDPLRRFKHPFPLSTLGRASYHFGALGEISLTTMVNYHLLLEDPLALDLFVMPEARVLLFDLVRLSAAGVLFAGDEDGVFGHYWRSSRVQLAAEVSF